MSLTESGFLGRREFLSFASHGLGGAALLSLLDRQGLLAAGVPGEADDPPPHHPAKAKRAIHIYACGGFSQVDTFDHKPVLEKFAGQPLPEGKKFINSGGRKVGFLTPSFRPFRPGGQSGLMISDFFPSVREHADKLAIINSCHTDSHAHGSALVAMNTGKTFIGRPSLGSWAVYGLGTENQNLPGYVVILDKRGGPISGQPNWSSGFMSGAFQGTLFRPVGDPVLDLRGPAHLDRPAQRRQLEIGRAHV